ncbi:hypothetical protein E6Q11_03200 [Candidatus Dojkabacteria bacterium]|uniref:Uncharacterized protein n=1 Tax=Candidatus Dojkabacteria bacterium TaxID=2099670 RepID=A0A5C7J6W0_9BACT|nr:MAG: hypothetical protein E6Q11_03200 [Candidatus Dojkabacteria bacterium]
MVEQIAILKTQVEDIRKDILEIKDLIKENTKISQDTLFQATKTNGRMNIVEPLAFDYREKMANLKGSAWTISLIGMAVLSGAYFLGNSYLEHYKEKLKTEISDQVTKTLIEKINMTNIGQKIE